MLGQGPALPLHRRSHLSQHLIRRWHPHRSRWLLLLASLHHQEYISKIHRRRAVPAVTSFRQASRQSPRLQVRNVLAVMSSHQASRQSPRLQARDVPAATSLHQASRQIPRLQVQPQLRRSRLSQRLVLLTELQFQHRALASPTRRPTQLRDGATFHHYGVRHGVRHA